MEDLLKCQKEKHVKYHQSQN